MLHDDIVQAHSTLLGTDCPAIIEADLFGLAGFEKLHTSVYERGRKRNEQPPWMHMCLICKPHGASGLKWHRNLGFGLQRLNTAGVVP